MKTKIVSYVMSGGIGSRLWPLSREDFPKQFHDFSGQGSMLARTLQRLQAAPQGRDMPIHIIGAEAHEHHLRAEIANHALQGGRLILEPIGRNTAAAVALATQMTLDEQGDALILVVPSDHEIDSDDDFWTSIGVGIEAALQGRIVTFGIKPDRPETGYGYIETGACQEGVFDVVRFVEKPNLDTAKHYLELDRFLWNSGIFLFSSQSMKNYFEQLAPQIWQKTQIAYDQARKDIASIWLPFDLYQQIPADSVDYAIMERADNVALVPARFHWNDLGSWQALLDLQAGQGQGEGGNVIVGDVVAINCSNSYLRSQSGLLSAIGLQNMAVVKTSDATFVAPVSMSQHVRQVVAELEKSGRLETKFTPSPDRPLASASQSRRVHHWLEEEALPLWAKNGVDERGGFYEKLGFDGLPRFIAKRMRTMARQIYVFACAHKMGWNCEHSMQLVEHGMDFIAMKGRGANGGWISSFNPKGGVLDATEDLYDQAFVLLALAHAYKIGVSKAYSLAQATLDFLDTHLADRQMGGYFETVDHTRPFRRSNPHMHLLEAYLEWFHASGEVHFLERAGKVAHLFQIHFFDCEHWTLGEYFNSDWQLATGEQGEICEPGHHFEWAWLLSNYAQLASKPVFWGFARKLYASGLANGINRHTGLSFNTVSKFGAPLDSATRSWPQTEIIKAAMALDHATGIDFKPEIEARVERLFRWHIDPAPQGLWIDAIDAQGRGLSREVPASILYHLVCALTHYLEFTSS